VLDRLKQLGLVAIVAGIVGVLTSTAPANAQTSENTAYTAAATTPAEVTSDCASSPPGGSGWFIANRIWDDQGRACTLCIYYAAIARAVGWRNTYCWEVIPQHALLYLM
jgi:hypothetical protein